MTHLPNLSRESEPIYCPETVGWLLPIREFREEYEETRRILSMVSNERMYSSLSGLPSVLLALLLVLRLPGEKAAGPPKEQKLRKVAFITPVAAG